MNKLSIYQKLRENKFLRITFIIFILVYIISPVDIVPDIFLPVGFLDDGLIASILVAELLSFSRDRKKRAADKKAGVVIEQNPQNSKVIGGK